MKKLLLLACLLLLLFSCKSTDPQVQLLVGRWEHVEYTTDFDGKLYKADLGHPAYTVFKSNGLIQSDAYFDGGWCNQAEKYTYNSNELRFTFSEPQCIPFVPQFGNEKAKILELTETSLKIQWKGITILFRRA